VSEVLHIAQGGQTRQEVSDEHVVGWRRSGCFEEGPLCFCVALDACTSVGLRGCLSVSMLPSLCEWIGEGGLCAAWGEGGQREGRRDRCFVSWVRYARSWWSNEYAHHWLD